MKKNLSRILIILTAAFALLQWKRNRTVLSELFGSGGFLPGKIHPTR